MNEEEFYIGDPAAHIVLLDPKYMTHRYSVRLRLMSIGGGMSADPKALLQMPVPERLAGTDDPASIGTPGLLPDEGAEGATVTKVFRRHNGKLAVSANQLRTMLSETASTVYTGEPGVMVLKQALYRNLRIEPQYIELRQSEPERISVKARTIKTPPFPRSVVNTAETVISEQPLEFELWVCQQGQGRVLREDVLAFLLGYAGSLVGLGADRKLELGRFEVERFELVERREMDVPALLPKRAPKAPMVDRAE